METSVEKQDDQGLYTFYPTYEEWKLTFSLSFKICNYSFLSYLWGMETKRMNSSLFV